MIEFKLLKTNDPNNKVVKSYREVATINGVLKNNTSVINPVITIDATAVNWGNDNVFTPNYAYIAAFGRYYHIKDIKSISNDLFEISLHVDVLMSWSAGLLASPCIASRNQNNFNLYLNDPNYKCFQNDYVLITKATGGFDTATSCFVLTIFGDKEYAGT